MKTITKVTLIIAAIALLILQGCDPNAINNPPGQDNDFQSALDNAFVETEFSNMGKQFDIEAQNSDDVKKTSAGYFCPCSQVTIDIVGTETYKMVIDYGSGCVCQDGRTREGILTGIFHGKWSEPGTYVEITPTNYKVKTLLGELYEIDFTKRITYNGPDNEGHISFTTKVNDAVFTSSEGTVTWETNRTTEWIEGIGDLDPDNNVYLLTGTASGSNVKGEEFDVEIEDALRIEVGCAHITQGILSLTPKGKKTMSVDYGDGVCDNKAIFSLGQFTTEIVLR